MSTNSSTTARDVPRAATPRPAGAMALELCDHAFGMSLAIKRRVTPIGIDGHDLAAAAGLNRPRAEPGRVVHVRHGQLAPAGPAGRCARSLVDLFMWELNNSPSPRRTALAAARLLRRERTHA